MGVTCSAHEYINMMDKIRGKKYLVDLETSVNYYRLQLLHTFGLTHM
jgi:hypothetical protein